MKILLKENVAKLGKAGEIVNVADGYAKNYLIPKKLGEEATKQVLAQWEVQKKAAALRQEKAEAEAKELAKELSKKTFTLSEKAGENGKLFGAVTTADVADALQAQFGLEIDKKKIVIPEDIKSLGDYTVQVKLMANAVAEVRMSVVADA
ncbi:MAG: 50S ribosomal protein L9 [Firmicutes bacterium]|nr:50S ribosomal protein L9 [Bacillota bacterium]